jgi:hypothetical protein
MIALLGTTVAIFWNEAKRVYRRPSTEGDSKRLSADLRKP